MMQHPLKFQTKWLIAVAPAALGVALAALIDYRGLFNPVVHVLTDLVWLTSGLGLVLSLLIGAGLALHGRERQSTQRQVGDAEARAAEERRRFLQRLDHELKNPLTAIHAGLANVAEAPADQGQRQALASIQSQAVRLGRLVTDLRKLAELETRPLDLAPVNLPQLLEDVFAAAQEQPAAAERQLKLTLPEVPWPLPSMRADQDLLFQALYNLLDNALKFTRPGDTIELRATEDDATVDIEVADTGPGIPEAEQPHIWDELYRGPSQRAVPGSGLGLALVRAVVARHHGQVLVRSRVGQGTIFSVRLPTEGMPHR